MKNKKSAVSPKKGMNRDSSASMIQNTEYKIGVNINTSSEIGNQTIVNLEPSNYYGVNFPLNYKVVGYKSDIISNRTYYFLTSTIEDKNNPHYKRSSIGYVDNNDIYNINHLNQEITDLNEDCDSCGNKAFNPLTTPLESVTQVPSLQYTELINDKCLSVGEGLNFDINFPAKKIEINQEKLGTTLYWNDYKNPPRFLDVTNLEEKGNHNYLFEINDPCEDISYSTCIDVDKLRIFPRHNRMILEPSEQQIGGNLKKGTYEFWGAYCDLMGNEMTQYSTPTNPISIFDENSNIMSQTETDEFTNFAIKLKVRDLDVKHFKYYKIAVVERNNVLNTQSVFLAGIYPTTDDTVVYTSSGSNNDDLYIARGNVSIKKRMDFNTLNAIKPNWERAKFTMVSGDVLWHGGLIQEEELNIQPVLNLFGGLLHWETAAASEDLYKNSIANSKYKAFPRDEVQPFGIRLLYKNGGYSATFPLIARPKKTGEDAILTGDTNLNSIINNSSSCTNSTTRNKKWQIYNTASAYDTVCTDIEESATSIIEDVTKTCVIKNVGNITTNSVTIELVENFIDLQTYLEENPSDPNIKTITDALNAVYTGDCSPIYIGDCDSPSRQSETNVIGEITNEVDTYIPKVVGDYLPSVPPSVCAKYKRNEAVVGYQEDTCFMVNYMGCSGGFQPKLKKVYVRDSNFYNESCGYADTLLEQNTPKIAGVPIFLNYDGAVTEAALLQNAWDVEPTTIIGNFKNKLHTKAQFFKVIKNDRKEIVFEVTKQTPCTGDADALPTVNELRYTIYRSCSSHVYNADPLISGILGGGIVDLNTGLLKLMDITSFPSTFIIAVDSPIITESVNHGCVVDTSCDYNPVNPVYKVVPPCGCFSMYARNVEDKSITISWDNISIDKVQEYQASCTFKIPKVNDCNPIPYKKGVMAYWESTETYPDNKQLWDSSEIVVKPNDILLLSNTDKAEFIEYYTNGIDSNGNYILKNTDFRCQPIRHSKFPDNTVSPYIIDNVNFQKEASSIIFPLGVELDSNVVKTAINLAYTNKLITAKQKDNIQGYEILRGDNSISKSVIANGIAFDVYNYEKNGDKIHFSNFPFNDLGKNKYCLQTPGGALIDHPFNSEKNYLYTFLSPDIFLTRNTIPDEVSLQGFVMGTTSSEFTAVDDHSEWTVLGQKARRTSENLAVAEVALELVIKTGELLHDQSTVVGVSSGGTSIGGGLVFAFIAIGGIASAGAINVGKYRYDWLKTFRDLGRTYNFANFQTASANYNKFLKADQYSNEYLRRLTIKKYLKDGDFTLVDENDGKQIKINNWLREASAFLSTGEQYPFDYSIYTDYINYDNNKKSIANSSNFVSSEMGCKENVKHQRNAASPYFTLKNYVPDQWGNIDAVKWLTTNNIFNLNENTACTPIFGGTFTISRFSWRRKTPIFRKDAIGLANKLPFMYSRYDNIGYPRFYCNYELDDGDNMYKGFLGLPYPDISSETAFDCESGKSSMYYKPPSKFYTSVHGVVDFLVESEINCNFRYAKNAPKDNFYPQNPNISSWLQQTNLPISEPNSFFYNNTYSFNVSNSPYKLLDKTYDKDIWRKRNLQKNAVSWSQKDVNENDLTNPWLVYKPLDWYEFKTNNGDLIDMHNIESNQFIARFENKLMLHNAIDVFSEKLTPQNRETGVAGMFYQRPLEFKSTDLGFMGTQHTDIVSTPYGHFWVDALRGKIFKLDENGKGLEIISEQIGNQPSNMKQWFREHLPMKILKQFPNIDIDNKYKGIGYNMWWDDKESRLFITKRDYVVKEAPCLDYDNEIGAYYKCDSAITCPEGFTYNSETEMCEKDTVSGLLCPIGYTYNASAQTCTLVTVTPATCEEDVNFDATSTDWGLLTTASAWESFFLSQPATTTAVVTNFSLVIGRVRFNVATNNTDLNLTNRNIVDVYQISINTLQTLRLSFNQIINFNPTTALPASLMYLYLSNNQIISFNPIIPLPNTLFYLLLENNQIVDFNPTEALPSNLDILSLRGNQIVDFNPFNSTIIGVKKIDLISNLIVNFNPSVSLPNNLETLLLNVNNIINFNPSIALPSSLKQLYLNANEIVNFNPTLALPSSLILLELPNNNITVSSWNTNTAWIAIAPNGATLNANNNTIANSIVGTNTETQLLAKGWTIIP